MTQTVSAHVFICMEDPSKSTREVSPAESNRHQNEVPMPEQKTGDVRESPDALPHLADGMSDEHRPDHPESERA